MKEVSVHDLKQRMDAGTAPYLLDVREDQEVRICSLPGAAHIPMLHLFSGLAVCEADREEPLVVYCHHGLRSLEAASFLHAQGYQDVKSLHGGIDAWAMVIDPAMSRY